MRRLWGVSAPPTPRSSWRRPGPRGRLEGVNGLRLTPQNVGNVLSVAMSLMLISTALDTADRHLVYAGQEIMARPAPLSDLVAGYHRTLLVLFVVSLLGTLAAAFGLVTQRHHSPRITAIARVK